MRSSARAEAGGRDSTHLCKSSAIQLDSKLDNTLLLERTIGKVIFRRLFGGVGNPVAGSWDVGGFSVKLNPSHRRCPIPGCACCETAQYGSFQNSSIIGGLGRVTRMHSMLRLPI
ncbi:hypothetical protein BU23DRAFT_564785 [Bimuria novae-zelandiae CBS 107.79]|uniref:Uncharacterized protein n=1 Tax=Bimuria novae-zelandiae CBS 107.79 TaxID=1447943 RepID=A0A6A5VML4_9PLEO|nr:hypothetical protein BU23DRAFT_564785 [Bimuria novae-zelandiae CBS 107.79]